MLIVHNSNATEVKISSPGSLLLLSRENYYYKFDVTSIKYTMNILYLHECVELSLEENHWHWLSTGKGTGEQGGAGTKFFTKYSSVLFQF